jgi:hypothetical protein
MSRAQKIRGLKRCICELKVLYVEAASILTDLLIHPSAAVVRDLCTRFHIVQAYFSRRYREAQELALAVLGSLQMGRGLS